MITVQLDETTEERLRQLAASEGQDVAALVKRVLEEFVELGAWRADAEEDWAEASVKVAAETFPSEVWPEGTRDESS